MEDIHTLKDLLAQGNWLAKVDLKDAYFPAPIYQCRQRFLQFRFQGKTFRFTCLLFDLSSAPWVFSKTLKDPEAILCQRGVWWISYKYNILLIAESRYQALDQALALVYLLECLGFTISLCLPQTRPYNFWASQSTLPRWSYAYPLPRENRSEWSLNR